jgi:hypothetical protein
MNLHGFLVRETSTENRLEVFSSKPDQPVQSKCLELPKQLAQPALAGRIAYLQPFPPFPAPASFTMLVGIDII